MSNTTAKVTIQPYLFFDGNCAEACEFYRRVFDAEVQIQTFGDAPMPSSPEQAKRVMHADISFGGASLFASDSMPNVPLDMGMRAQISVNPNSVELGRRYFEALAEEGEVTMPYEKQFWGDTFGMVTDRFGVKWMVNARDT